MLYVVVIGDQLLDCKHMLVNKICFIKLVFHLDLPPILGDIHTCDVFRAILTMLA